MRIASAFALWLVASNAFAAANVGQPAPDFSLKDEAGKIHKLSDYKGKTVVLEWTNPECPFVLDHYERGTMKSLAEKFGSKDKNVVWIAIDSSHMVKPEASAAWKKKWSFAYNILQDADGKTGEAYGATNTPHMYIVDKDGVLRYRGAIDSDASNSDPKKVNYVDAGLTALLAGKSPDPRETKAYGCTVKYKK